MRHFAGTVLLALLAAGTASGIEVGVTVMQDRLYQPTLDSIVQPTAFLAGVEFGIGKHLGIELRGGYSGFFSWNQQFIEFQIDRAWVDGYRIQAVPRAHVPAPFDIDWLGFNAGLGLAGARYESGIRGSRYYREEWGDILEHETWAGVLSFVGGICVRPMQWLSFDVEFERAGLGVYYTERRSVYVAGERRYNEARLAEDIFCFGWLGDAKTAIGAAIRFSL